MQMKISTYFHIYFEPYLCAGISPQSELALVFISSSGTTDDHVHPLFFFLFFSFECLKYCFVLVFPTRAPID